MIAEELTQIKRLFDGRKRFYPFGKIFLFLPSTLAIPNEIISAALQLGLNFYAVQNEIFNNSIPYLNLNYRQILNLYTNQVLNTTTTDDIGLQKYYGTVATHPLFDKSIVKSRPFRISVSDCPPYVEIYNAEKKQ